MEWVRPSFATPKPIPWGIEGGGESPDPLYSPHPMHPPMDLVGKPGDRLSHDVAHINDRAVSIFKITFMQYNILIKPYLYIILCKPGIIMPGPWGSHNLVADVEECLPARHGQERGITIYNKSDKCHGAYKARSLDKAILTSTHSKGEKKSLNFFICFLVMGQTSCTLLHKGQGLCYRN